MATDNQIVVNRLNTQPSTGAEEDKGESRRNESRGVTAEWVLLEGEDPARFQALCEDLYAEYQPTTRTEECWVQFLAAAFWRLGRAPVFEAAVLEWSRHMHDAHDHRHAPHDCACRCALPRPGEGGLSDHVRMVWGRALDAALTKGGHLTKLARHEGHLLRQIERTLKLLRDAKSERVERRPEVDQTDSARSGVQVYLMKQ